ncbi:MAG: preprotein translocase subunit YajC [Prevotellaceae bacterium]|nr:preprotein translocase subunit YajC [Prevotellaceae bacterium]
MLQSVLLQAQGGGGMSFLLMMVLLFAVMWFFMIRPQQKKQKEIQKFQNSLEVGQPVIIGGGIYGTVKYIDTTNNTIEVEIAKGVNIRVDKNSVFKDMSALAGQPQKK